MGLRRGIGQPAGDPVDGLLRAVKGEAQLALVPRLGGHFGKIQAFARNPGGGAGLEPAQGQAQSLQAGGEVVGGVHPVRPHVAHHLSGKGLGAQKGAGGKDDSFTVIPGAAHQTDAPDGALGAGEHLGAFSLGQVQMFAALQRPTHIGPVGHPVGLGPGGVDRGALAPVEHPELQAGGVCRPGHLAAQSVDLPHQLPLGGAADGGVAGHIADALQRGAQAQNPAAQPGGGQGRLDARVSRAHHHDVILSGKKIKHGSIYRPIRIKSAKNYDTKSIWKLQFGIFL